MYDDSCYFICLQLSNKECTNLWTDSPQFSVFTSPKNSVESMDQK